jgi:hypothetical protein
LLLEFQELIIFGNAPKIFLLNTRYKQANTTTKQSNKLLYERTCSRKKQIFLAKTRCNFHYGNEQIWIFQTHKSRQKEKYNLENSLNLAFIFGVLESMQYDSLLKF